MSTTQTINRNYDAIAWGLLLIWWGITELVISLPQGIGAIGIGLILIGINVVRKLNGLAMSGFSTTLGVLALIWGGLELAGVLLDLPFELPIFPILLIALGLMILVPALTPAKSQS